MDNRYEALGVSSSKKEVHDAIRKLDKGLFPQAFCKILPDFIASDPDSCNIMHADTAGTKTSLAYMYWKETGDINIWKNIAQDALVMNLDDMACVGCLDSIVISSTIGRNKHLIPATVIQAIIEGTQSFIEKMKEFDIHIHSGGGETADVGDIVRTIDVGITAFGRMKKSNLIVNDIQPGQVIVGLASFGQASYELNYNSGIGSNGLTGARHALLHNDYAISFPESYSPESPKEVLYSGPYHLTDAIEVDKNIFTIGDLILSPTRTFLPVIKDVLHSFSGKIKSIIHCTGGGQTKVLKFVSSGCIIKDNLFEAPPVFQLIRDLKIWKEKEMFEVFNMGHRLELYTDLDTAHKIIERSASFNIDAKIIGRVEPSLKSELRIHHDNQEYQYSN